MKKIVYLMLSLIIVFSVTACAGQAPANNVETTQHAHTDEASETVDITTENQAIELTLENVEEYLSFEVSKEYSDVNPDGADHILKVSPLVEGDYSGVSITVEIPLYDHWYNSYTTEIDLTADITLTKVGKFTAKHPIFCDVADLYETRGAQGDDDPTYIIKSVSGTVK